MELTINDLGDLQEAVFDIRANWYSIGLMLKISVGTLDSIRYQYSNPADQLRETLKEWLRKDARQSWAVIVDILRSSSVGEPKLACAIEARYCQRIVKEKTVLELSWQKRSSAPEEMSRGAAASDDEMAYFICSRTTTVHAYDIAKEQWSTLPDCPHTCSCLVIVDSVLTSIGGLMGREPTSSLLSLMGEVGDRKWLTHLPPMPTKRYCLVAVCSGRSLIAAGGHNGCTRLTTVEVLDIDIRQWFTTSSLPHKFTRPTAAICGERLYLLGGIDDYPTHSVLSCSVHELCKSQAERSTAWQSVADIPHYFSTCVTLCGQLVAVGGGVPGNDTTAIITYDRETGSWQTICNMLTARCWTLVAVLPNNKMMVVGGVVGGAECNVVEIATVLSK